MTGNVAQENFDCSAMYELLDVVRCFDPSFANEHEIEDEWVDKLARVKPIADAIDMSKLKEELGAYRAAARGSAFHHNDV